MNIFTRIINELMGTKKVNVLTTIDESKDKHILNQDIQVQIRNSPDVPKEITEGIINICKSSPEIERCHVLDVHDPNSAPTQTKNFIVIATDDNESYMDNVACKMQEMLTEYPYAQNCFITASDTFPDIYETPQYAIYIRKK